MSGRATALAAAALLLAGCGGAGDGEDGAAAPAPVGSWQLVSGSGPDGPIATPLGHPITLSFEDEGRLGGTAACNSYGASVRIEGDRLELDELSQTEMACEPAEVMEAEAAYLDALRRVERLREDGESLVLDGPDAELVFQPLVPASAEELVGTSWELDTVVAGESASTPAAPATLLLHPDGRVEGHTGCRELAGEYELRGPEVRLTRLELEGDVEACAPAAAEQDAHVAEVLGDGFRAEVQGDRLTLTSAGEAGLVYRAGGAG